MQFVVFERPYGLEQRLLTPEPLPLAQAFQVYSQERWLTDHPLSLENVHGQQVCHEAFDTMDYSGHPDQKVKDQKRRNETQQLLWNH